MGLSVGEAVRVWRGELPVLSVSAMHRGTLLGAIRILIDSPQMMAVPFGYSVTLLREIRSVPPDTAPEVVLSALMAVQEYEHRNAAGPARSDAEIQAVSKLAAIWNAIDARLSRMRTVN